MTPSPAPSSPGEPSAALATLASEVERRGMRALPGGDLRVLSGATSNAVVSPFGVGLTQLAAEAALGDRPNDYRRYAALTHTVAACFGAVSIKHELAFAKDVDQDAKDAAWLLSPGSHRGRDEPGPVSRCAPVFWPVTKVASPTTADLLRSDELLRGVPALAGARLGRSLVRASLRFRKCRDTNAGFRACGEREESMAERLTSSGESPPGIEVAGRAHVEEGPDESIVVVPVDAPGITEAERRPQSLVVVVPKRPCEEPRRTFDDALVSRARAAVKAPRDVELRLNLPLVSTETDVAAAAPAPLDGLLVSAATYVSACGVTSARPAEKGTRRVRVEQPFLYAVLDDATGAVLLLGRFDKLDRKSAQR